MKHLHGHRPAAGQARFPPRSAGASLKPPIEWDGERLVGGFPPRSAGASLKRRALALALPAGLAVFPRVQRGPH